MFRQYTLHLPRRFLIHRFVRIQIDFLMFDFCPAFGLNFCWFFRSIVYQLSIFDHIFVLWSDNTLSIPHTGFWSIVLREKNNFNRRFVRVKRQKPMSEKSLLNVCFEMYRQIFSIILPLFFLQARGVRIAEDQVLSLRVVLFPDASMSSPPPKLPFGGNPRGCGGWKAG